MSSLKSPSVIVGTLVAEAYINILESMVTLRVASSPVSPIFSTHARKEGEHARDVGLYTRVGRVADSESCAWARTIF